VRLTVILVVETGFAGQYCTEKTVPTAQKTVERVTLAGTVHVTLVKLPTTARKTAGALVGMGFAVPEKAAARVK
jgi:hypothetical protein